MPQRPGWAPDEIDIERPSVARMYDYFLGGSHNFTADRELAEQALSVFPDAPYVVRANRAFLRRAVTLLCGLGIDQFLDFGSGIPTVGNVHEVAHAANPAARIVYVDSDPVAAAHSTALLDGHPLVRILHADLREPRAVLHDAVVTSHLDLSRPVSVLLVSVLPFIPDADDPAAIVAAYREAVAPGSYLAISHGSPRRSAGSKASAPARHSRASSAAVPRSSLCCPDTNCCRRAWSARSAGVRTRTTRCPTRSAATSPATACSPPSRAGRDEEPRPAGEPGTGSPGKIRRLAGHAGLTEHRRMARILITGANKGLGYESARRLIAAGHTVYLGSRDAERGRSAAERLGARLVLLDVADDASVDAAAKSIEADGGLDVLVNNAGIEERGPGNSVIGAADVTADMMRSLFETNVFGLVRVTHAFLSLLQKSAAPVVVNVSSGLASMARVTDPGTPAYAYPGVAYPASKSAVNMITVQFAKAFPNMRINAVEPGYTKTDLNGNTGLQTVEQGAEIIVRMAQVGPDGPTGGYFDAEGPLPW